MLKKRCFNFLARFSHIDKQTDLLAHIVNPQFLTASNHRLRGKRIATLAVPSLAECSGEGSSMSLRQSEETEVLEASLPNGNLGISTQYKQHKKNKTPLTTLSIDADQMRNAMNLLMCNIQSKGLCVRQGHTEANDQAFSFSN